MKRWLWLPALAGQVCAAETNAVLKLVPPYAELPPTFWELHGSAVISVSAAAVLVVALVVRFALRPRPVAPVPLEVRTRNTLAALQTRAEDGVLLSEVSQTLRRYFSAAFNLPTGEVTTAEFCRQVQGSEAIGGELAAAVGAFLQDCDQRKFAPAAPAAPTGAVAKAQELFERAEVRRQALIAALNPKSA